MRNKFWMTCLRFWDRLPLSKRSKYHVSDEGRISRTERPLRSNLLQAGVIMALHMYLVMVITHTQYQTSPEKPLKT